MINRHLVHLWRQMKIHRILTHVCLQQIGCLYYCCYATTSSPAVQKRHSKVYGNPIAHSLYSILLGSFKDKSKKLFTFRPELAVHNLFTHIDRPEFLLELCIISIMGLCGYLKTKCLSYQSISHVDHCIKSKELIVYRVMMYANPLLYYFYRP